MAGTGDGASNALELERLARWINALLRICSAVCS